MTLQLKKIECWNCNLPFPFNIENQEDHTYRTYCPFCDAENIVDLNPHRKPQDIIFKSEDVKAPSQLTNEYDFPDKIKGQKPES